MLAVDPRIVLGIVSFGYSCGAANTPGVYTQLSFYLDWMESNSNLALNRLAGRMCSMFGCSYRRQRPWSSHLFGLERFTREPANRPPARYPVPTAPPVGGRPQTNTVTELQTSLSSSRPSLKGKIGNLLSGRPILAGPVERNVSFLHQVDIGPIQHLLPQIRPPILPPLFPFHGQPPLFSLPPLGRPLPIPFFPHPFLRRP